MAELVPSRVPRDNGGAPGFRSAAPDITAPLEGGTNGLPAARRVYHAVLVDKLETDGALSTDALIRTRRLGWFLLPLEPIEVTQLVDSALAHGIIEPLQEPRCCNGETRWIATERGRHLPLPRGASAHDYGSFATKVGVNVREIARDWWPLVIAGLAAGGIGIANEYRALVAAAVFLFVVLVVLKGVRAERDLKAAAEAWPRLKVEKPARWRWQTLPGRPELVAASWLSVAGLLAAAWTIDSSSVWELRILIAAGVIAAGSSIAYRLGFTPQSRAWRSETG